MRTAPFQLMSWVLTRKQVVGSNIEARVVVGPDIVFLRQYSFDETNHLMDWFLAFMPMIGAALEKSRLEKTNNFFSFHIGKKSGKLALPIWLPPALSQPQSPLADFVDHHVQQIDLLVLSSAITIPTGFDPSWITFLRYCFISKNASV